MFKYASLLGSPEILGSEEVYCDLAAGASWCANKDW